MNRFVTLVGSTVIGVYLAIALLPLLNLLLEVAGFGPEIPDDPFVGGEL